MGRLAGMLMALPGGWGLFAHPMGNFSVNHYCRLEVSSRQAQLEYALDLAEIPSFELLRQWNLEAGSPRTALEQRAIAQAREWVHNLEIRANGRAVSPQFRGAQLAVAEGAGGMPVLRITAQVRLPVAPGKLEYQDRNYTERAGWKEIVIVARDGARIEMATQGSEDRSKALTEYPPDPTIAPPQDLRASLNWSAAIPVAKSRPVAKPRPPTPAAVRPAVPRGAVTRGDFLSRLLGNRQITWWMMLAGIAVAFGLGAMHALSPGHGKTIVAAYLVGARGTAKHAMFLGGMVTFTHTISVFLLGFATLFLSQYVLPERIYPVLGLISGISIVWVGAVLLYKRARRLLDAHPHGHEHHHPHSHPHTHPREGDVTVASLIALGASGGLVPCPSALVLLLSSIALGHVGLGLLLLVGFSAGLAIVLMGIGLLVLYAKHLLPSSEKAVAHPAFRWAPVLSAAVIVCVGLVMTGVSLGVIRPDRLLG